jgi:amidase
MGITEGLPVGLGVVAKANDEISLVSALAQIERALDIGILTPSFIR